MSKPLGVPLLLILASFVAIPGAGFAGSVPETGSVILAQAPGQDPNTPPDCKKYPKDVRCKDQKK